MIDTTRWRQELRNQKLDFANDWEWNRKKGIDERHHEIFVNPYCKVKVTAARRFGTATIEVEASLPKVIYENNVRMLALSDVQMAFDAVGDLVFENTGIEFDPFTAELSRLDIPHNWKLNSNDEVYARIEAVRCSDYSRRMRGENWQDGVASVKFRNKGKRLTDRTVLYSKFDETRNLVKEGLATKKDERNAERVLRLERKLHRPAIRRLNITPAKLFDADFIEQILSETSNTLGLHKEQFGRDERFTRLREYCTDKSGKFNGGEFRRLHQMLALTDELNTGDECVLKEYMSQPTFLKCRQGLKEAGVWLSRANKETLSPLPSPKFPR